MWTVLLKCVVMSFGYVFGAGVALLLLLVILCALTGIRLGFYFDEEGQ